MKKITVVTLSGNDSHGGIQTHLRLVYKSLSDSFDIKILSLCDESYMYEGIEVIGAKKNLIRFLFSLVKISFYSNQVLFTHVSVGRFWLIPRLFNWRLRHVVFVYGTECWKKNIGFLKYLSLVKASRLFVISRYSQCRVSSVHRISPSKFMVVPCGLDIVKSNDQKSSSPYERDSFNVLTILRLDSSEKLESVYSVFEAIRYLKMDNIPISFTVIGSGTEMVRLQDCADEMGISDSVTFTGYIENTSPYLEHCDLFTLLSPVEGFGIVYLEAMAYSKPVLGLKHSGASEPIVDNKNGYLLESGSSRLVAEKIGFLSRSPDICRSMGQFGRYLIETKFSSDSFRRNLTHALLSVIQ